MKKIKFIVEKIWKDSVMSKVIAVFIVFVISSIFYYLYDLFKSEVSTNYFVFLFEWILSILSALRDFLFLPIKFSVFTLLLLIISIILADKKLFVKYLLKIFSGFLGAPNGENHKEIILSNLESRKTNFTSQYVKMCFHKFKIKPVFSTKSFDFTFYFNSRWEFDKNEYDSYPKINLQFAEDSNFLIIKYIGLVNYSRVEETKILFEKYNNEEFEILIEPNYKISGVNIKFYVENFMLYNFEQFGCEYFLLEAENTGVNNLINIKWIESWWS